MSQLLKIGLLFSGEPKSGETFIWTGHPFPFQTLHSTNSLPRFSICCLDFGLGFVLPGWNLSLLFMLLFWSSTLLYTHSWPKGSTLEFQVFFCESARDFCKTEIFFSTLGITQATNGQEVGWCRGGNRNAVGSWGFLWLKIKLKLNCLNSFNWNWTSLPIV